MLRFIFLCISVLSLCLFSWEEGFASVTHTYTPGPVVGLTGVTSDTYFDVSDDLYGYAHSGAYLDTVTQNMSGAFYIKNIGWTLMSTGSFQVKLDCGAQSIGSLTTQCQFTGSGWAENIGEISFANIRYNPISGTLSGSIDSFAGKYSVEGIYMPLKPAEINESLSSLSANHATYFSIFHIAEYASMNMWEFQIIPKNVPTFTRKFSGGGDGKFIVDLSYADGYQFEIIDPFGGKTVYDHVVVEPNSLDKNLDLTSGTFIEGLCTYSSSVCPDGVFRSAATLSRSGSDIVADGTGAYEFTLKLRDRYGNRIDSGTVDISYTGTANTFQANSRIFSTTYIGGVYSPIKLSSDDMSFVGLSANGPVGLNDIRYKVASIAPTNPNNTIVLEKILYKDKNGVSSEFTDSNTLGFDKPVTTILYPPSGFVIGQSVTFTGYLEQKSTYINPSYISLFLVGSGTDADIGKFNGNPTGSEKISDVDWMIDSINPSSFTAGFSASGAFSLDASYVPRGKYPLTEGVQYYGLVHYPAQDSYGIPVDVVYEDTDAYIVSEYGQSRVTILGYNNARSEYGTVATTSSIRSKLLSTLRKNISLLTRGRTTFSDVPYIVGTGATVIQNSDFDAHHTIVSLGGDITLSENIIKRDYPLAIIALTDENGNGGNIQVNSNVTDLSVGIFAERSFLTSGNKQLYIFGSLISGNTLGETVANICPYYIEPCVNPEKYDLEYARSYTGITTDSATSSTAKNYPKSSLIIEYDSRLQSSPPPGLPN